jgi:hypothetical protein
MNTAHTPPVRGRPGRTTLPDRANHHVAAAYHSAALTQGCDRFGDNLPDQSRLVFIGLGTIAALPVDPFHDC